MNKDKLNMTIAVLGVISILTMGGLIINENYKNHKNNESTIEKCFENFDKGKEIIVTKNAFWSKASCEKD